MDVSGSGNLGRIEVENGLLDYAYNEMVFSDCSNMPATNCRCEQRTVTACVCVQHNGTSRDYAHLGRTTCREKKQEGYFAKHSINSAVLCCSISERGTYRPELSEGSTVDTRKPT
eukprot:3726364-Rhodomonas_salina.1